MILTTSEQKERYYNLVLEKANKIYASWRTQRIRSKRLVMQASEYALDNRLKVSASYRFYVFAFVIALGIRIERRYGTFFRRLFLLFAYLGEKNALKMLKNVLGFHNCTDMREMIEREMEKIALLLSQKQDQQSTGGGKRFGIDEVALAEELNAFFEACEQEEEQKTADKNSNVEKEEGVEKDGEPISIKAEDEKREQISVEELESGERTASQRQEKKSPPEKDRSAKMGTESSESSVDKNETTEKPAEKSVANTSILAEMMALEQERETTAPSPFPVFRENLEERIVGQKNGDSISVNEKNEMGAEKGNGESVHQDAKEATDRTNGPFPVFHGEKVETGNTSEKPMERDVKDIKGIKDIKPSENKTVHEQPKISEENKARISLNTTMSEEEISALAAQVIASANQTMNKDEQAQREKIAVEHDTNEVKSRLKQVEPSLGKTAIPSGIKK